MSLREPTSSLTHLFAAFMSVIGMLWLMWLTRHDTALLMTVIIYGLCSTVLYVASGVYHGVNGSPRVLGWLVKFDRVGIFLKIAGTYTPITYFYLDGVWRWLLLLMVWGMAIGGSVYVLFFYVRGVSLRIWSTLFYVAMGCAGVVAIPHLLPVMPVGAVRLLVLGGGVYVVGAVIYSLDKPNFHKHFTAHDLWHVCVMSGSGLMFMAILIYIALPQCVTA
ncbi:MAG: hemolysin [Phototrophicales bacterium]|nr:MAG: hemolysin [Phototrophicales bacterium]RMG71585.1 MAG: hemolysin III family protein [Chloroflexota bacterium]